MTVDITKLQLRAGTSSAGDVQLLTEALAEAIERVRAYIQDSGKQTSQIPPTAVDRAVIRCALALFNQDKAPNGVLNQQYDLGNGEIASTPTRISQDPMKGARAALSQWISEVFLA